MGGVMTSKAHHLNIPTDRASAEYQLLTHGKVVIIGEITEKSYESLYELMINLEAAGSPDIELHINSMGGSCTHGFLMYDIIRLYKGKVTGIVIGEATSMASVILQACAVRKISRSSVVRIHTAGSSIRLVEIMNERKVKDLRKLLEALTVQTLNIYMLRAKTTSKQLSRLMTNDTTLSSTRALKLGLVDEVI
jgi:ATP-dependent protease ClpP protease subunit